MFILAKRGNLVQFEQNIEDANSNLQYSINTGTSKILLVWVLVFGIDHSLIVEGEHVNNHFELSRLSSR